MKKSLFLLIVLLSPLWIQAQSLLAETRGDGHAGQIALNTQAGTLSQSPPDSTLVLVEKDPCFRYRNPALAFCMSLFVGGTGQLYNRQTYKGIAMLTVDVATKVMMTIGYFKLKKAYDDPVYDSHKDGNTLYMVGMLVWIGNSLFSAIDAVGAANSYNRSNLTLAYKVNPNVSLSLQPDVIMHAGYNNQPAFGARLSLSLR